MEIKYVTCKNCGGMTTSIRDTQEPICGYCLIAEAEANKKGSTDFVDMILPVLMLSDTWSIRMETPGTEVEIEGSGETVRNTFGESISTEPVCAPDCCEPVEFH